MIFTHDNTRDRLHEADDARNARANRDDGATGRGYNWRPDYFKPRKTLIFRASNYAWTYALLETPRDKMLTRLDRYKVHKFLVYQRYVMEQRALYQPRYCGQPAPRMNLSERIAA